MKYLYFFLILLFFSCQEKPEEIQTRLYGTCDHIENDILYISDLVRSKQSWDTVIVENGKFYYSISTPVPDIRNVTSKSRKIDFAFATLPGDINYKSIGIDYIIDGELNNKIKKGNLVSRNLLEAKQSLFTLQRNISGEKDSVNLAQKEIELDNEIKSTLLSISEENNNSIIAGLSVWASLFLLPENKDFYTELYQKVDSTTLNQTTLGELLQTHKNKWSMPISLPNAALYDETFYEVSFSDVVRGYTFVDFWASWCGPCRKEIPKLKEVYASYESKDIINFKSISIDSDMENWVKARIYEEMPWDQYIVKDEANDTAISKHYGKVTIPFGVLLDPSGKTIANNIKTAEELESILQGLDL